MYVLPRIVRTREANPCHEPAGKATGGQFAPKGSAGCAVQSTGEQPALVDQQTGQPKFHPVPPPEEKKGLKVERPKGTPKPPKPGAETPKGGVTEFRDASDEGDADDALSALGVRLSAREIAEGMVSQIAGESFEVRVTARGYSGGESYDGPDPDDVRSDYDEWYSEQVSDVAGEEHGRQRRSFVNESESGYIDAGARANDVIAQALGEDSFVNAETWNKPYKDMTPDEEAAFQHTNALAERLFHPEDGVINEEGYFQAGPRANDIVREYIAEHPGAKFLPFPDSLTAPGSDAFDKDYRLERSRYFNDDDGWDNWIEDGHEDSAIQNADIRSFDDWYEREYGHHPDKYGTGGDGEWGDGDTQVEFQFTGDQDSHITRTFFLKDGELHVHHDYFTAGGTGDGLAKQLFQGSLPTYDRMGVQHISTYADIDVGAYAWARFGFQADSPRGLSESIERRAKRLFKDTGLFDDGDWQNFTALLDPTEETFIWDVVDAKYYTTPEKARSVVDALLRSEGYGGSSVVANKKLREEAEKGLISVGRLLMAKSGAGDAISWEGTLYLQNEESVKRLEGYVGVWRKGRQGLSTEQPSRQTGTDRRAEQRASFDRTNTLYAKAGRFNDQMAAYNAASRPDRRLSQSDANLVWQRVQQGVPFERAVQDKQHAITKRNAAQDARLSRAKALGTTTAYKTQAQRADNDLTNFMQGRFGPQVTASQRKLMRGLMADKGMSFYNALRVAAPKIHEKVRRGIIGR